MARTRAGLLVASALSGSALAAACTFGIDTTGLAGDGGHPLDATSADTTSPEAGGPGDASRDAAMQNDASKGVDAPADSAREDAPDSTGDPCAFTVVQASPGTTVGHVMTDGGVESQLIDASTGNLLVAIAYGGQNPGYTTPPTTAPNMHFSVSDTLGNTFYAGGLYENSRSNQAAIQIFYAANIKGGTDTVTVTSSTSPALHLQTGLFLQEYGGAATTDVVDVSSGQMAPSKSANAVPPLMTTSRCDLVVGAFTDGHVDGTNLLAGSGWTLRSSDTWDPGGAVDSDTTGILAGKTVQASIILKSGPDDGWVAAQMGFRAAKSLTTTQPTHLAFSTPSRTVAPGACSEAITIACGIGAVRLQSAKDIPLDVKATDTTFFVDPACTFPTSTPFIGAGLSSTTLYFKATSATAGPLTITASASGLSGASQSETIE